MRRVSWWTELILFRLDSDPVDSNSTSSFMTLSWLTATHPLQLGQSYFGQMILFNEDSVLVKSKLSRQSGEGNVAQKLILFIQVSDLLNNKSNSSVRTVTLCKLFILFSQECVLLASLSSSVRRGSWWREIILLDRRVTWWPAACTLQRANYPSGQQLIVFCHNSVLVSSNSTSSLRAVTWYQHFIVFNENCVLWSST
jgi:hypothetical protein